MVKFAPFHRYILAFSSFDGTISICNAQLPTPGLIHSLQGHLEPVTCFDWSERTNFIVSTSEDKTVRVWSVDSGDCCRTIYEEGVCTACKFHPVNNNIFVVAVEDIQPIVAFKHPKKKHQLKSYNMSTGLLLKKLEHNALIRCVEFNTNGNLLFAGDDQAMNYFSSD